MTDTVKINTATFINNDDKCLARDTFHEHSDRDTVISTTLKSDCDVHTIIFFLHKKMVKKRFKTAVYSIKRAKYAMNTIYKTSKTAQRTTTTATTTKISTTTKTKTKQNAKQNGNDEEHIRQKDVTIFVDV